MSIQYEDAAGLIIDPKWVAARFKDAGLSRKAFEAAAKCAGLKGWQITALLDVYADAAKRRSQHRKVGNYQLVRAGA